MRPSVRFGIRGKLFLFVVAAFVLLLGLILGQIRSQAQKASQTTIDRSLEQSSIILNTFVENQFYSIREVANSISKDGRVLPLVFESDAPTLQDLSLEFKQAFDFDSLFFINADGIILARSDRPEAVGANLKGKSRLFDQALSGTSAQGTIVSGGNLLQIVVEPIFDNVATEVVRGLVAVAYIISEDMIRNLEKLTASDMALLIFSRNKKREIDGVNIKAISNDNLATGLNAYFENDILRWQTIEADKDDRLMLNLKDETYFSTIKLLNSFDQRPLGFVMALRSKSDLMKPFWQIERAVLVIGGLCLLVAIMIAMFLAYRISAPLLKLVGITDDIQEGRFSSDYPQKEKPSDEIDLLFNSVLTMGKRIKEKNELETYLAGLAMEIDSDGLTPEVSHQDKINISEEDATHVSIDQTKQITRTTTHLKRRILDQIDKGHIIDKRYELAHCIGEGTFGKVFLAHDTHLSEDIAIKIMDQKRLAHSNLGFDMHEEIKLARRITHRNITRTYDFGTDGQLLYITMEYVEGFTLDSLVNTRGSIAVYPAMILVKQLCSAIQAAHEQGIIHRDLKPQNITINRQGVLKIMDFGLAMSLEQSGKEANENSENLAAGTPRFMAPEQFTGGKLDERTDIYALGGLSYYVFSGTFAYDASSFEEFAHLHYSADIPTMLDINTDFPKEIDTVIQTALQKTPENRFQSAKDMLEAFNKIDTVAQS